MIIEQAFTVNASREATAAFFCDIDRVSRCVPGVENVQEIEPGRYQAVLGVRLGPIRAAFQGAISLDDAEAPAHLKASGEGRDRATGSVAKVHFTADLTEDEPGRTTVTAVADVALRGRMAQFGTGVMRAAAGELVKEFAACANRTLGAEAPEAAAAVGGTETGVGAGVPPPAPTPQAAPAGVLAILVRGLARAMAAAIRRLRARWAVGRSTSRGGQR